MARLAFACDPCVTQLRPQAATTLSGGERGASLARALVGDPKYLIVDEPITGLDPGHAMAMMRLLSDSGGARKACDCELCTT